MDYGFKDIIIMFEDYFVIIRLLVFYFYNKDLRCYYDINGNYACLN